MKQFILSILILLSTNLYAQCQGDVNGDGVINVVDIVTTVNLIFTGETDCEEETLHGCLDSQACNYDPTAMIDNNSCYYCYDDDCDTYPQDEYDCNGEFSNSYELGNPDDYWDSYMRITNFNDLSDTTFYQSEELDAFTINYSNNKYVGYQAYLDEDFQFGGAYIVEKGDYIISQDSIYVSNRGLIYDTSIYEINCTSVADLMNGTLSIHYEIQDDTLNLSYNLDTYYYPYSYNIEWKLIKIPEPTIIGCTDSNFLNYNPIANFDNGFCNNINCDNYLRNQKTNSFLFNGSLFFNPEKIKSIK